MTYHQITSEERYTFAALRQQGFSCPEIARRTGRHRSTVWREFRRNRCHRTDGAYRPSKAAERTNGRRSRARRHSHFSAAQWQLIDELLRRQWSPEQIAGRLQLFGVLSISHETIYRHVWRDQRQGGDLHRHLRGSPKQRRKRYGAYDSRGRLAGKRHISERPAEVENRKVPNHWEIDTVMGKGSKDCIVTLCERKTGFLTIGKLPDRTQRATTDRVVERMKKLPGRFKTITADNGTEFHDYKNIEIATGTTFYFATPYHSWERGTSENTNGLIRQYLPKGTSMASISQHRCNAIARKLNSRPRKRLGYRTPEESFNEQ